jgi:hypothetical protein
MSKSFPHLVHKGSPTPVIARGSGLANSDREQTFPQVHPVTAIQANECCREAFRDVGLWSREGLAVFGASLLGFRRDTRDFNWVPSRQEFSSFWGVAENVLRT